MPEPASRSVPLLEVVERSEEWLLAVWSDTVISRWIVPATATRIEHTHEFIRAHAQKYPQGICTLTLVEALSTRMDASVRQASTRLIQETADITRCRVTVVTGGGFLRSALRGILIGMEFFQRVPSGIYPTIEEAVEFLAKEANKGPHWGPTLQHALRAAMRRDGDNDAQRLRA